ncbi:phage gene 29 protein family protein [Rhodococcus rhodnii]|uniref:DUF2744 domain-containing protein n=2 Tax=Rhodococcus rhodnii TaxID=38312 RepID=R7WRE5_9NOCA|nr:DUF2744 domain-containing protein [Rhodococcus rhodnii]EOM77897.1 hypothetical protein Rrhod_0706 [Rhodococcus rhodnii LMG 5362]
MIPIQATSNPDDPQEHALWALVGIKSTGVPMLTAEAALRELSEQLWHAGFRHHPELQTRKVATPPGADGVHWLALGAVHWVDIDEPEPEASPVSTSPGVDLASMSAEQKIALADQLRAEGVIRAPEPQIIDDVATVGRLDDRTEP